MKNRKPKTRRKYRVKRGGTFRLSSKVSPSALGVRKTKYSELSKPSPKNSQRFSLKNWLPWSKSQKKIVPGDSVETTQNPFNDS